MAPIRRLQRSVEEPARKSNARAVKEDTSLRTVSTKAIFKHGHDRVRKSNASRFTARFSPTRAPATVLGPSRKVNLGKSILTKRSPPLTRRPALNPLIKDFNDTTIDYRDKVKDAVRNSLEQAYTDLVDRLHRASLQPDNGLSAQLSKAADISSTMTAPLGNDVIEVVYKGSQGLPTRHHVPLGETVASFADKLEEKRDQISELWREWESVQQEIAELGAEMLDEPNFPRQFGLVPLEDSEIESTSNPAFNAQIVSLRDAISDSTEKSFARLEKEAQINAKERTKTSTLWISFLHANES